MRLSSRRTAQDWAEQHSRAFADYQAGRIGVNRWWRRRVQAQRKLIDSGVEAVPFALEMLKSRDSDIREDGASILGFVGQNGTVVDALIAALESEHDHTARDSAVEALGQLKSRRAIPALTRLVEDPATDGDTREGAARALASITK